MVTLVVTTWIAFHSWDAWWRFLAHPLRLQQVHAIWTGLLSSNLLVLQLVFMARLPWLERTWGSAVTSWSAGPRSSGGRSIWLRSRW